MFYAEASKISSNLHIVNHIARCTQWLSNLQSEGYKLATCTMQHFKWSAFYRFTETKNNIGGYHLPLLASLNWLNWATLKHFTTLLLAQINFTFQLCSMIYRINLCIILHIVLLCTKLIHFFLILTFKKSILRLRDEDFLLIILPDITVPIQQTFVTDL